MLLCINGMEIIMSMMEGESGGNLRKLFVEAEANSPSFIFIIMIWSNICRFRKSSQGCPWDVGAGLASLWSEAALQCIREKIDGDWFGRWDHWC